MNRLPYTRFFTKVLLRFIFIILLVIQLQANTFGQLNTKKKISTVVIDPGHGGKDPGAHGSFSQEKNIALHIALKLGNYIKKNIPDVKVIYTRETDIFIPLLDRAPIANKNQADLFISIHVNSNPNGKAFGTETYAMGLAKTQDNLEVAKRENSVILLEDNYSAKYDGYDPKSSESFIIFSLVQNTNIDQSLNFASYVQSQLNEKAQRLNRGVKQAGYLVLWKTTMPSVLIETGFISNTEEEKFINSENGSDMIASAIYRAFKNYKHDIENRSVFVSKPHRDSLTGAKNLQEPEPEFTDTIKPEITANTAAIDTTAVSVEFMVQICASKRPIPLNAKSFKGYKLIEEIKMPDAYKYGVGKTKSYPEALKQLKNIKNEFTGAFVVGLVNGKIIPVKEALKQIKD